MNLKQLNVFVIMKRKIEDIHEELKIMSLKIEK